MTGREWRKTKIGDGLWQVYGIGDLRWTIFGTVEKVYGGWFAVTASQDERSCEQLKEGCQWVADQHKTKVIKLQPARHTDHLTSDGTEFTKLPYPFHVTEDGLVLQQELWRGDPARVVGFAADLARQQVDLWWAEAVKDPQRAVGMYVVTEDTKGGIGVHLHAIAEVTELATS